ncbi:DNA recombination protein RmuC [Segetibacter aerophilus]|uniref:DNA recombination protein RmuC n=1 Tax=Segetibacter aerophilus TaxID=670293 RepID=A0A512BFN6_9BACT|nr:DNA recombination protein RmuC [Segetibacter aerophilus]GEO10770.1 DNA recombination protein RmuC [Segetibacter aerophilus]
MIIYVLLATIILLLIINLIVLSRSNNNKDTGFIYKLDSLQLEMQRVEGSVKTEIASNRKETFDNAALARRELASSLISFEEKLSHLTNTIDHKLTAFNETNTNNAKDARTEIRQALDTFKKDLALSIQEFNGIQKENFYALLNKQGEQNTDTGNRLDNMRETLEKKIFELQHGNEQKLEQIRITVDEKLQQTLETRLGESFKLVSDRLEAVHKGLGDMQQLATGVGDLKRVLGNVKTRGLLGEYQLENLLEQTLTPDQYAKNVKTKEGSNALVEFAVKLPGNKDKVLWLPIDSKFPKEDFEWLMQAYELGDLVQIEESRKAFVKGIKKCASDICGRYIDPPNTTDFAILFLPFESLYAEVLRTPGLFESIRTECKINIAGPTTLSAFLSSLQMGFRTLAIERRSGEVWQLLSAVKTEFGNFSGLLEKAQKNIQTGLDQLENVAGVRTRAIQKRLKGVDTLTDEQLKSILPELTNGELLLDEEE